MLTSNMQYGGVPVFVSLIHTQTAETPSFPESRHRSARVYKKLVKRLGVQWPQVPACFKSPKGFHMHPSIWEELKRQDNVRR